MVADVADVADFEQQVTGNFALHAEIILIRNWRNLIRIEIRNRSVRRLADGDSSEAGRQGWTRIPGKAVLQLEHDGRRGLRRRVGRRSRVSQGSDIADGVADSGSIEYAGA